MNNPTSGINPASESDRFADDIEFIRLREVKRIIGLSTTSIYVMAKKGTFPKQIRLGGNSVAWIKSEVLAWAREQVARSRGHAIPPVSNDQQPMNNQR